MALGHGLGADRPLLIEDAGVELASIDVHVVGAPPGLTFESFWDDPEAYLNRLAEQQFALSAQARAARIEDRKKLAYNHFLEDVSFLIGVLGFLLSIFILVNDMLRQYHLGYAVGGPRCAADIEKGDATTAYCASHDCYATGVNVVTSAVVQSLLGTPCSYLFFEIMTNGSRYFRSRYVDWDDVVDQYQKPRGLRAQMQFALKLLVNLVAIGGLSTDWLREAHLNQGFSSSCIQEYARLCPPTNSTGVCGLIDLTRPFDLHKPLPPAFELNQIYALLPVLALALIKIALWFSLKEFKEFTELPRILPSALYVTPFWGRSRYEISHTVSVVGGLHGLRGPEIFRCVDEMLLRALPDNRAWARRRAAVTALVLARDGVGAGAAGTGLHLG